MEAVRLKRCYLDLPRWYARGSIRPVDMPEAVSYYYEIRLASLASK